MTGAIRQVPDLTSASELIQLKGIGPSRSSDLAAVGLRTVGDLLFQLPIRYEDRRRRQRLSGIQTPGRHLVLGVLVDLKRVRIRRRRLSMVRGFLVDGSCRVPVIWFNRPYLVNQVEEGTEYALYGEFRTKGSGLELVNPSCDRVDSQGWSRGVVPVYPAVGGLGATMLRRLIRQVIERCEVEAWRDPLPDLFRQRHNLPRLGSALIKLHRPDSDCDVETLNQGLTEAHARLSYGEFLELQIELKFLRGYETRTKKKHTYDLDARLRRVLVGVLPFRLTGAQRRVLKDITDDLAAPEPMLRLLQGDVGSGKTIVAVLALVMAMENGLQGAFMAPTELLAEQHYRTLASLLQGRYNLALLTSSVEGPEAVKRQVARGEVQLVVGTHSLIQDDLEFSRLGLAVVDEQHRFGVGQRRLLRRKGEQPDLLVMTATPIPRSLALTVFGDLSLSVIDELPPGRRPIETRIVPVADRRELYQWLQKEVEEGVQAYVVFPLIEESESLQAASIERMGNRLRRYLSNVETAVLHGRVAADERDAIMNRFRDGEIRVLIATTVIEVGVDVPNASVMLIESGERFGLSQLHQLRGRVGRGPQQSSCVVVHGSLSDNARRRLDVFGETTDGFRIAEADLRIRGQGDLLGTRQSGQPLFRLANIIRDHAWLERAREDAQELFDGGEIGESETSYISQIRQRAQHRFQSLAGG